MLSLTEIDSVFSNILFIHAIHKQFFSQLVSILPPDSVPTERAVVDFSKLFSAMFVKACSTSPPAAPL
jgi:hypothetical protein